MAHSALIAYSVLFSTMIGDLSNLFSHCTRPTQMARGKRPNPAEQIWIALAYPG